MNLSPWPKVAFLGNNGRPLVGGKLFTYEAGTNTKLATYSNESGTLNTNPVVLDFRGEANVWLDPELTYKFVLADRSSHDPPTNPIWSVDDIAAGVTVASLTQQFLGRIIYPRTQAEIDAGVTPTFYIYPPGNVLRYGATGNGATDDTVACQDAIDVAANGNGFAYFPAGSYSISGLVLNSVTYTNIQIRGDGWKSLIKHASGSYAINITAGGSLQIFGLKFDATGNSSANAAVFFGATGRATISDCFFNQYTKTTGTEIQKGYPVIFSSGVVGICTVKSCQMGNGYGGIFIDSANGIIIDDNVIESITGPAININAAGNGIAITNNVIQTMLYGIYMAIASGVEISGNYFEASTTTTILAGASSQVRGCEITGNYFGSTSGTHQIIVDLCHGLEISGNEFNTQGSIGIIKIAGAGSTIGVFIGINGLSSALVTAGTYTLLTQTSTLTDGQWWDIKNIQWVYGSSTRHQNLLGASASVCAAQNSTNTGVNHVGGATNTTLTDNQAITLTMGASGALIVVHDNTNGKSASFFANYNSSTIVKLADPDSFWQVTNTDSGGNYAIYKSGASVVVTIKNYSNGTVNFQVNCIGLINAATAPA